MGWKDALKSIGGELSVMLKESFKDAAHSKIDELQRMAGDAARRRVDRAFGADDSDSEFEQNLADLSPEELEHHPHGKEPSNRDSQLEEKLANLSPEELERLRRSLLGLEGS